MSDRFSTSAIDPFSLAEAYDELPLWAAPFGIALLGTVRLHPGMTLLDVGCGTGFPLIELAQRVGREGRAHGVDPWRAALARARRKCEARTVANVELHEGVAEALPLADRSVDLIVSNNGLNNVSDLDRALAECARVARQGAQLVFTFNLPDSLRLFYDTLQGVLTERGDAGAPDRIAQHIFVRRRPVAFMRAAVERAGFRVAATSEGRFTLRFSGAAALFDHAFMRLAFLGSWLELVPERDRRAVFGEVQARLDGLAQRDGGLALDIPFACVDATRE
jgi:arsenite methyltransferase